MRIFKEKQIRNNLLNWVHGLKLLGTMNKFNFIHCFKFRIASIVTIVIL